MKTLLFERTLGRVSSRALKRLFIKTIKTSAASSLLGAILLTTQIGSAIAGTATGNFTVTAGIMSSCKITGATLDFGTINPVATSGAVNSSTPFLVKCTNGTPYTVGFDDGTHRGANTHSRNLQNASGARDLLAYQVFLDIGRTAIWGAGTGELGTATGNGMDQTVTVYAQIPNASTISPGMYSDCLTLTVTY